MTPNQTIAAQGREYHRGRIAALELRLGDAHRRQDEAERERMQAVLTLASVSADIRDIETELRAARNSLAVAERESERAP